MKNSNNNSKTLMYYEDDLFFYFDLSESPFSVYNLNRVCGNCERGEHESCVFRIVMQGWNGADIREVEGIPVCFCKFCDEDFDDWRAGV